jgi:hypothetical protein
MLTGISTSPELAKEKGSMIHLPQVCRAEETWMGTGQGKAGAIEHHFQCIGVKNGRAEPLRQAHCRPAPPPPNAVTPPIANHFPERLCDAFYHSRNTEEHCD